MQQSLEFFCEECGAANPGDATQCFACQSSLTPHCEAQVVTGSIKPVTMTPQLALQVTASSSISSPGTTALASHSDTLAPGMMLHHRYKIECEIGQGGYSIVYKARDTAHDERPVTIKQIHLRNLSSRQVIEATETFNRETTLLPGLKHPGIPRFYGHFTDPEHWYLVMEYIAGQTLEDSLQTSTEKGYFSLKETLKIGIALCSILEYLHHREPPLIFRDIKPANILLTRNKRVYLIDFGIARAFSPEKAKDTTPLGSPGYAAPEQYGRGQSDQHTDIYGLGATLQTLLTGCDPLDLRQGMPSRSPHPIPPEVQRLLERMMAPNPDDRPRSISIVKQLLRDALPRLHWVYRYLLGVGLVAAFYAWSVLTALILYNPSFDPLNIFSFCFLVLAGIIGLTRLPFSLIVPKERPIALGELTVISLLLILFSAHLLSLPFLGM